MSFFSWLWPQRAIDASDFNLGDDLFGSSTSAGVSIDPSNAMTIVTVWACVTLIADAVANLPMDVYRRTEGFRQPVTRTPQWTRRPNPEVTLREFNKQILHSLLIYGNAYVAITERDGLLYPSQLAVIPPSEIVVARQRGGPREYLWTPEGVTFRQYSSMRQNGDLVHIMGAPSSNGLVGLSPIDTQREMLGFAKATELYGAKFFGQGAVPSGQIEMPAGSVPTDDQLKSLSAQFRKRHSGLDNAWKPIVLANGAKWTAGTIPNDQAQFLETRKLSKADIAALYRVPPHLISDVERSTSWGSGIEEQNIGFVTDTLGDPIRALEDSFTELLPRGQYARFNVNARLRGNTRDRYSAHQVGIQTGFMSRNEARLLEDLPPVDGLDEFLIPVSQAQPQEQP